MDGYNGLSGSYYTAAYRDKLGTRQKNNSAKIEHLAKIRKLVL